jgi:hypothetical protein
MRMHGHGLARGTEVLKRRGLLAGVAALVGGGLARLSAAERTEAAHDLNIVYDPETVVHVDVTNTTTGTTAIRKNMPTNIGPAFVVQHTSAPAFTSDTDAIQAIIDAGLDGIAAVRGIAAGWASSRPTASSGRRLA